MTRDILNKIAKKHKVNLEHYMKVTGFINPNYTKVFVIFFDEEGVGTNRLVCNRKIVTLNVNAIQRREKWPEDYCTRDAGGEWIYEIK